MERNLQMTKKLIAIAFVAGAMLGGDCGIMSET